jgi:hypothetical protein
MARAAKDAENLQVFRGSFPKPDVFVKNAGDGCCGPEADVQAYDKLADRVHFDNSLAHSNPLGANDKYRVPGGDGFSTDRQAIIDHINANGVGAQISILVIPTFAFLMRIAIKIAAEETGLTFDLKTRNGLTLPADIAQIVDVDAGTGCAVERTLTLVDGDGDPDPAPDSIYSGFGALGGSLATYLFGSSAIGEFALEADEIIMEVATMPAGGVVSGLFDIDVAASYEVVRRCDEPV